MKKIITSVLAIFMVSLCYSQKVRLTINHKLGADDFAFNQTAMNDLNQQLKFSRLEYYISGISIMHDGGMETKLPETYILANAEKQDTFLLGEFSITTIETINFSIGVDPLVNNGDPAQWPNDHPLAPKSPSMHWGWAAGYRFVAIEAKSGDNFAFDFQIHALGNKNYFKQSIPMTGSVSNGELVISLNADYLKAIKGMDISSGLVEHSENNEAMTCLKLFHTSVFTNQSGEGNTLSVKSPGKETYSLIYPNPSNGHFTISMSDKKLTGSKATVTNLLGETILEFPVISENQEFYLENTGIYFLTLSNSEFNRSEKIIVN
ncbi:MAG: T9SS type A sorting domain-containing protein [Flavobacteriales bacterium]|nr:T9SS type A sorting domain-containing protein [Flavobacteriales bacterium]